MYDFQRVHSISRLVSHLLDWFNNCFLQELCRQAKIEYAEETRKAQELHDKIKAEIAEAKYNKHYNICWEVRSVTGNHEWMLGLVVFGVVSIFDELSTDQPFPGLQMKRLSRQRQLSSPAHLFLTFVFSNILPHFPCISVVPWCFVVNVVLIVFFCNVNGKGEFGWRIPLPYPLDCDHATPPPPISLYLAGYLTPLPPLHTLASQSSWFAWSAKEGHYNSINGDSVKSSRTLPPRSSPLRFHP